MSNNDALAREACEELIYALHRTSGRLRTLATAAIGDARSILDRLDGAHFMSPLGISAGDGDMATLAGMVSDQASVARKIGIPATVVDAATRADHADLAALLTTFLDGRDQQ